MTIVRFSIVVLGLRADGAYPCKCVKSPMSKLWDLSIHTIAKKNSIQNSANLCLHYHFDHTSPISTGELTQVMVFLRVFAITSRTLQVKTGTSN